MLASFTLVMIYRFEFFICYSYIYGSPFIYFLQCEIIFRAYVISKEYKILMQHIEH